MGGHRGVKMESPSGMLSRRITWSDWLSESHFDSWVESGGKEPRGREGVQSDCNS